MAKTYKFIVIQNLGAFGILPLCLYFSRECSTNRLLFYAKQTQSQVASNELNPSLTSKYEKLSECLTIGNSEKQTQFEPN